MLAAVRKPGRSAASWNGAPQARDRMTCKKNAMSYNSNYVQTYQFVRVVRAVTASRGTVRVSCLCRLSSPGTGLRRQGGVPGLIVESQEAGEPPLPVACARRLPGHVPRPPRSRPIHGRPPSVEASLTFPCESRSPKRKAAGPEACGPVPGPHGAIDRTRHGRGDNPGPDGISEELQAPRSVPGGSQGRCADDRSGPAGSRPAEGETRSGVSDRPEAGWPR